MNRMLTLENRRAISELEECVRRNTPIVEERLRRAGVAGVTVDVALVYSAAKYFDALEKLGEEIKDEQRDSNHSIRRVSTLA